MFTKGYFALSFHCLQTYLRRVMFEISLCVKMVVISYLNLGENLSQNIRVGLCAKVAGA